MSRDCGSREGIFALTPLSRHLLSILLIGFAVGCNGRVANLELTEKVAQLDTDTDGTIDYQARRFYRGGRMEYSENVSHGHITRLFYYEGKLMFSESDDDGDGFAETLRVWHRWPDEFRLFERRPDGSIHPATEERLIRELRKAQAGTDQATKLWMETLRRLEGETASRDVP